MSSEEVSQILARHKGKQGELISVLEDIQARYSYLPQEYLREVAVQTGRALTDVYGVATFYKAFSLQPRGKHLVSVCLGTACHMKGGRIILEAWERELDVKVGETTPDREFSLERVACVGCCAMAPVALVDEVVYGNVSPTKVDGILLSFKLEKEKEEKQS